VLKLAKEFVRKNPGHNRLKPDSGIARRLRAMAPEARTSAELERVHRSAVLSKRSRFAKELAKNPKALREISGELRRARKKKIDNLFARLDGGGLQNRRSGGGGGGGGGGSTRKSKVSFGSARQNLARSVMKILGLWLPCNDKPAEPSSSNDAHVWREYIIKLIECSGVSEDDAARLYSGVLEFRKELIENLGKDYPDDGDSTSTSFSEIKSHAGDASPYQTVSSRQISFAMAPEYDTARTAWMRICSEYENMKHVDVGDTSAEAMLAAMNNPKCPTACTLQSLEMMCYFELLIGSSHARPPQVTPLPRVFSSGGDGGKKNSSKAQWFKAKKATMVEFLTKLHIVHNPSNSVEQLQDVMKKTCNANPQIDLKSAFESFVKKSAVGNWLKGDRANIVAFMDARQIPIRNRSASIAELRDTVSKYIDVSGKNNLKDKFEAFMKMGRESRRRLAAPNYAPFGPPRRMNAYNPYHHHGHGYY
jgi:hypothetical protein